MPAHGIAAHFRYILCLLSLASLTGCAMCASDLDCYYPAYGGKRARADMVHGRVGSIIDPAHESTESFLVEPDELPDSASVVDGEPTAADASSDTTPDKDAEEAGTENQVPEGPELRSPFRSTPNDGESEVPEEAGETDVQEETMETADFDPLTSSFLP
jgi:hypothetical protein